MRKLFILLLLCGAAYYLYTHGFVERLRPQARFSLPDSLAWRYVSRSGAGPEQIEVCLVHGNRWRIEMEGGKLPRTLVCVFDGSRFASNAPRATAEIYDPRPTLRDLIQAVSRAAPEATEQRDGHTCWRLTSSRDGISMRMWLDTQTHFPVYAEGTMPDGQPFEWHYSILALDLERNGAQYFNTNSTVPLFSQLLKP